MSHSSSALKAEFPGVYFRRSSVSEHSSVLTDIYQDEVNLAVWQNQLSDSLINSVKILVKESPNFKAVMTVTPENVYKHLVEHSIYLAEKNELCAYISLLVDMFCTLFDLKRVGLRLTLVDRPMCPKFHVDRVPCRLITTFYGTATEWLPHDKVDRSKLGAGSKGLSDEVSGIMKNQTDIQKLKAGDVALLKGEGWYNNQYAGLVHRSPSLNDNEFRLLLTLDFID